MPSKTDGNEEYLVTEPTAVPFGLTRMRPFPDAVVLGPVTVVLDPKTQTGRWLGQDGLDIPDEAGIAHTRVHGDSCWEVARVEPYDRNRPTVQLFDDPIGRRVVELGDDKNGGRQER